MSYRHNVRNKRKARERAGYEAKWVPNRGWVFMIDGRPQGSFDSEAETYKAWRWYTYADTGYKWAKARAAEAA